jgi:hypothetical protein
MHIPAKYKFYGPNNPKNRLSKIRENPKKIEKTPKFLKNQDFLLTIRQKNGKMA